MRHGERGFMHHWMHNWRIILDCSFLCSNCGSACVSFKGNHDRAETLVSTSGLCADLLSDVHLHGSSVQVRPPAWSHLLNYIRYFQFSHSFLKDRFHQVCLVYPLMLFSSWQVTISFWANVKAEPLKKQYNLMFLFQSPWGFNHGWRDAIERWSPTATESREGVHADDFRWGRSPVNWWKQVSLSIYLTTVSICEGIITVTLLSVIILVGCSHSFIDSLHYINVSGGTVSLLRSLGEYEESMISNVRKHAW